MSKFLIVFSSIVLIVSIFSMSLLMTILRDWVEVYKLGFEHFNSDYILNLMQLDTLKIMFEPTMYAFISWVVLVFPIMGYLKNTVYKYFKDKRGYSDEVEYGSHGTASFMNDQDKQEKYGTDQLGWFLGGKEKDDIYKLGMDGYYHPVEGELNMQMTVIGSPGSIKTTGFVLPNLFHLPYIYRQKTKGEEMPDIIITDPKCELYELTAEYYKEVGYDVKVLDFTHLKYGDSLNCLDFIQDSKELMEVCEGYVQAVHSSTSGGESGGSEAFWIEQEGQLLAALVGAIRQSKPKERQTLEEVLVFLTTELTDSEGTVDIFKSKKYFEENVTGAPLKLWRNVLLILQSDKTAANILGGLATKLKYFTLDEVNRITSHSTFDITQLGRKKEKPIVLYLFMSDSDRTFAPIINLILTTIFKRLYRTAYEYNNRLEAPVYFIIDEMANIGKISGMKEMLGTMRGRRIYPMMIWQSLSQMKNAYGDGWENIVSQCDTRVYLGVNDIFTAEYCSKTLGATTIKVSSKSTRDSSILVEHQSESESYMARELKKPDEVMRNENYHYIMTQRATKPSLINKVQYKHWEKAARICDVTNYFKCNQLKSVCNELNQAANQDQKAEYEVTKNEENIENKFNKFQ